MRKSVLSVILAIACCIPSLLEAQTALAPGKVHLYEIPQDAPFLPGRILAKVKPQYRQLCQNDQILYTPVAKILSEIQTSRLTKAFPKKERPSESQDAHGRKLADLSLIYEIQFQSGDDLENVINHLLLTGIFEYAEPQYLYETFYNPSDPDTTTQYYLELVKAREAWDHSKGDSSIVIGIIDTGTSFNHPDIAPKLVVNAADPIDGMDNDNDGYIDNYNSWDFGGDTLGTPYGDNDPQWSGGAGTDHGVIVSGPAGAATDNNYAIASIGFDCSLLPVKVNTNGGTFIGWGYQGIVYAADHGASIQNLAWGGGLETEFGKDALRYAAVNKNCLLVASAGNTPIDVLIYPAASDFVLSVAGTQQNDSFWNSNPTFGTTYNYLVDLAAPARDIRTTVGNAGSWGGATGTSLAAPMVCGAAGLVKAKYPHLSWYQCGEVVRRTADNIYAQNPSTYSEKMGTGRLNCFRAVVDSNMQSLRIAEYAFDDQDDGILEAGDTILVRVRWSQVLGNTRNLNINLTTPDFGDIEIIEGSLYAGDLNESDTLSNWQCPFKIRLRNSVSQNFRGFLRFEYQGDVYDEYEYKPIRSERSYVLADANDFELSLDSKGNFGYLNGPGFNTGIGMVVENVGPYLVEGGLIVATSASNVASNITNTTNSQDQDFQAVQPAFRNMPGTYADLEAHAEYQDASTFPADVRVEQTYYQFDQAPDEKYIILEYTLHNDDPNTALSNAFAGIFLDWELGWDANNYSRYDAARRMIWGYEPFNTPIHHMGIKLLTPDSMRAYSEDISSINYTDTWKFNAVSSNPAAANSDTTDIAVVVGAGPFSIAPGDSHKIAFAIIEDKTRPELFSRAEVAYQKYWCVIRGGMSPQTDLGPDIMHCSGDSTFVLDAGAGYASYLWNNGATTQSISVDSSGEYIAWVTDANGCSDYDKINLIIDNGPEAGFSCTPTTPFIGDTVLVGDSIWFADASTGNVSEWGWDFGDGSGACSIFPGAYHVFSSPGVYEVTLTVGNGVCEDSFTKTVYVDFWASADPGSESVEVKLSPNPNAGRLQLEINSYLKGNLELRILDLSGKTLWSQKANKSSDLFQRSLNLSHLPNGMYLIECRIAEQKRTLRFVKQ